MWFKPALFRGQFSLMQFDLKTICSFLETRLNDFEFHMEKMIVKEIADDFF